MPTIKMEKAHSLTEEQAREKVDNLGRQLSQKHGLSGRWKSAGLYQFSGMGVSGEVSLEPGRIAVQVDLPFLLSPLKGKVEQKLREGLDREFS
jgi:putative polyhydroxyalkanoate system protein